MTDKKIEITTIPSEVKVHRPKKTDNQNYNLRSRIYVRAVSGLHQLLRRRIGIVFLGLFALLPWLQFGDRQAILLDIVNQEFHIFGLTLWPQDLTLLASIFIISAFCCFLSPLFTGVFGADTCVPRPSGRSCLFGSRKK